MAYFVLYLPPWVVLRRPVITKTISREKLIIHLPQCLRSKGECVDPGVVDSLIS